jgi:DNA polymerase theta
MSLVTCVQVGRQVKDTRLNVVRELETPWAQDRDNVAALCWETVAAGHSVLVFCPTKKNQEGVRTAGRLGPIWHAE